MKVLALGALWVPYIRENWFDALRRVLGDQVTCIDAAPLMAIQRGRPTRVAGQGKAKAVDGYHTAYIYDVLRREKFDYLFFYSDWIFGDFHDAFFEKVRATGVKTVTFHPDDEPEHWYTRNTAFDHHFDFVASHSSAGTARRLEAGWGKQVMYLPWGYNPRTCHAIPESRKKYDVVFIGKHKVSDAKGQVHVEDGEQREKLLVRLSDVCARRGWVFRLFGYGWEKHPKLKKYAGGVPSQEDLVRIYNETKIVFNPAWSSDGNQNAVQTKLRHFEVPGCGAFQLTNRNHELAELFVPGKEIEFFADEDELIHKVELYVRDNRRREAIARAGHERALTEHTLDHRVKSLFARVRKVFPPQPGPNPRLPRIKTFHCTDKASLAALRSSLAAPGTLRQSDWIHVVGGKFVSASVDYAVLAPFLRCEPERILAIQTYMDFAGLADNPLQPQVMESAGRILSGKVHPADCDFFDTPGGFIGTPDDAGNIQLIINFIAPRKRAIELLDAFLAESTEAIANLDALPVGRIVSEVLLPAPDLRKGKPRGIRETEYVRRMRSIFPRLRSTGAEVVLYGISGLGAIILKVAEEFPGLKLRGVIDRSLKKSHFNDIPVLQPKDLERLRPDVVVLSAMASGATIYEDIEHIEGSTCILPLYDLNHPVWSIVLP